MGLAGQAGWLNRHAPGFHERLGLKKNDVESDGGMCTYPEVSAHAHMHAGRVLAASLSLEIPHGVFSRYRETA